VRRGRLAAAGRQRNYARGKEAGEDDDVSGQAPASARITAAVELLDLRPDLSVLEIGCGHGVALTLVADRLDPAQGGRVLGLDRSAKMIDAARARNEAAIAHGAVGLLEAEFEKADLPAGTFDLLFTINVAQFWRAATAPRFLERARELLAPGATIAVFNQPPSWRAGQAAEWIAAQRYTLTEAGFEPGAEEIRELAPAALAMVQARRPS
jgi:cyclopropane fatty-acyl-phospholipid synthase-like methyltransferase